MQYGKYRDTDALERDRRTRQADVQARLEAKPPITLPYILIVSAPLEIDEQGRRWTTASWAKDLALHLDYLTDLTLVSPATQTYRPSPDLVSLNEPQFDRLKYIDLPCPTSHWEALKTMPTHLLQYWRAIDRGRIVHAGFGGWPINGGLVAIPLAKMRGRFILANVESSFWRASPGRSWRRRLQGPMTEVLVRTCLRLANVRLFTSKAYLEELMPAGAVRAYVTPATWLDDEWILSEGEARQVWAGKCGPVRMLFAGRLVQEKGIFVLLSAIKAAAEVGTDVEFSIHPIGDGGLRDECFAAARSLAGRASVTVLDQVPFGEPFLGLLRGFDAVLLPSLSDEQPRIAYEALSQAVPVIGSSTGGIREVVESGVNGRLSPPNNVDGLVGSIIWAGRNRAELREMGLRGLASVRRSTHKTMHRNRHDILLQALGLRTGGIGPSIEIPTETSVS
jgi:glycosyltransferase involved in cell wall biosynthesis